MEIIERKTLDFGVTVRDTFVLGLKNAPSIIAAAFLWLITIWIPYINIGTTIAMEMLPVEMAKGNIINPLSIFDSKWRRYMGEFLLTGVLSALGILLAMYFLIIPGIVLALAWGLGIYFLIEKNMTPMQALKASNDATYGNKWNIFGSLLIVSLCIWIMGMIILLVAVNVDSQALHIILAIVFILLAAPLSTAFSASVWRQLKDNVE